MGAACVIRLFKQFSLLEFIHFISAYFLFDWKKKLVNKLKSEIRVCLVCAKVKQ
jgi:hypothetical protein